MKLVLMDDDGDWINELDIHRKKGENITDAQVKYVLDWMIDAIQKATKVGYR